MLLKNKYLPAEWAEQEFILLIFPNKATDWAKNINEVQECYCEIINAILCFENVLLIADKKDEPFLQQKIKQHFRLTIHYLQFNDTWARDTSAITIFEDNIPTLLNFTFNGWGLKFAANLDNLITENLYTNGYFPQNFQYRDCRNFVLEGGSIESDGYGTILTTTKCLLSQNRNYLMKSEIEQKFIDYFGTKRILWLSNGYLKGDDTDSHIDTLARFCNVSTIAYVKCNDKNDEHFIALKAMENELQALRTLEGLPYSLISLPMADKVMFEGERLPATYANFLIINGAVLMPAYNSSKDETAKNALQLAFPDREIIPINCLPLIKQHGSLHCVTMQFPQAR